MLLNSAAKIFASDIIYKRLYKIIGFNTVLQGANAIAPLIILLHLTSQFGPEDYAVIGFSQAFFIAVTLLTDFGLSISLVEYVSVSRDSRSKLGEIIGASIMVKGISFSTVSILLFFPIQNFALIDNSLVFILFALPFLFQALVPVYAFQGLEEMSVFAILTFMIRVLTCLLIIFLVASYDDAVLIPLIIAMLNFFYLVISLFFLWKKEIHVALPSRETIRKLLAMTFPIYKSRLSAIIYSNTPIFILGFQGNSIGISIYSVADQVLKGFQTLFHPFIMALLPFSAFEKDKNILLKTYFYLGALVIFGWAVWFFLLGKIVELNLPSEWLDIVGILDIFIVTLGIFLISAVMGFPSSSYLGNHNLTNKSNHFGLLCYILGVGFLIGLNVFSTWHLALLVLTTEVSVFAVRIRNALDVYHA